MLTAIQRVLPPGAKIPFHDRSSDGSESRKTDPSRADGMNSRNPPFSENLAVTRRGVARMSGSTMDKQWPVRRAATATGK